MRIEEGAEGVEPFNSAMPRQSGAHAADASWRDAILAALTFAVPVGILSSGLLPFASGGLCLWVIGGAIAAVNLYRRRSTASLLDTRVGLRIGLVLGLTAGLLSSTLDGLIMVAERYVLHKGEVPDKEVQSMIELFMAPYAQNPQAQSQLRDIFAALNTGDGKAALVLFVAVSSSLGILAFSSIGGALGAKIFSIRKMGVRNS